MPRGPGRRPTMADLARETRLSVPTVSRALRDHPDVSLETRRRVREAVASTGYRMSATAQSLRTGRTNALSFVLPYHNIGWWEPLLKGAGVAAAKQDQRVIVSPVGGGLSYGATVAIDGAPKIDDFFDSAVQLPVDGFIVVTPESDGWHDRINVPVVIIDDLRRHPGKHVFLSDNRAGAYTAVRHLIGLGRSRILAVVPGDDVAVVADRLAGYREALGEAGFDPTVLYTDETYPPTLTTSDCIDAALDAGTGFDGIFVFADYLAFSVLRSLRRAGIRVPEDVSVVGFDDDLAALATDPMLTTMAQPLADIGARAVELLIRLVEGEHIEPTTHHLTTQLVVRGSA